MKKIRINYPPTAITVAGAVISFIFMLPVIAAMLEKENLTQEQRTAAGTWGAVWLGGTVILIMASYFAETVVVYGRKNVIRCRWLFIIWEIDISRMKYFIYTIEPHHVRGGTAYTFNVEFAFGGKYGESRKCLRTRIDADELSECMQGSVENMRLMPLYRFVEECYPEKAMGYERCM